MYKVENSEEYKTLLFYDAEGNKTELIQYDPKYTIYVNDGDNRFMPDPFFEVMTRTDKEGITFKKIEFTEEEKELIKETIKYREPKMTDEDENLKLVDIEVFQDYAILYLGKLDMNDYYGDDWNDAPYDCNAGLVYSEFIEKIITVKMPEDLYIESFEEYFDVLNMRITRNDQKWGIYPVAILEKTDEHPVPIFFNMTYKQIMELIAG